VASHSVLVFPAGMPNALTWARHASKNGVRIVGASSLAHDPARGNYAEWISLPWIGEGGFSTALSRCLAEHRIDAIFTSHPVVWSVLRDLLPKVSPDVSLEPVEPWAADLADYRVYRDVAARFASRPLMLAAADDPAPGLPPPKLAALVRMFQSTPGQCDDTKLEALAAIFAHMPQGDVVEIGTLWGRSAVALAFLAAHYKTGNLLCVDPWLKAEIRQGIPQVDAVFTDAPMEEIFEAFRINLAPFAGRVNYARARSKDAVETYGAERCFTAEDFGRIEYTGEIALLHIDGNHALEAVRSDVGVWQRFVCPGGWIVFDDYCWPFGEGPRIAADEFLLQSRGRVATAFIAGGALFANLTEDSGRPCFAI
jgi:hypothetical protein